VTTASAHGLIDSNREGTRPMDKQLLEILVCPVTKANLTVSADRTELISVPARLAYPVRDGIPVMLESEARPLTPEEVEQYRR